MTTFTYSREGNIMREQFRSGVTTYVFDDDNRAIAVIRPDGTRSPYTDSEGFSADIQSLLRTADEAGGPPTTITWDGTDYIGEY